MFLLFWNAKKFNFTYRDQQFFQTDFFRVKTISLNNSTVDYGIDADTH